MNQIGADQVRETPDVFQGVHALRDDIRIRIHLAGMEARDHWVELEKEFYRLEGKVKAAAGPPTADIKALEKHLAALLGRLRNTAP